MAREKGQTRVLELQQLYGVELCVPSRYVVRDEILTKVCFRLTALIDRSSRYAQVCRTGRRRFHFALFNDALCYGSEALLKKYK
jgi:hypothetical protein